VVITSPGKAETIQKLGDRAQNCAIRLCLGGPAEGLVDLDRELARMPATPLAEEPLGSYMFYSSGTTGRPKGIKRAMSGGQAKDGGAMVASIQAYGFTQDTVYLSPAPIYHAAPCAWSLGIQALGGTVVLMERFDEEAALRHIEQYRITHSQWVPTMFIRMLKLPAAVRGRYDLSSHTMAVHAAAPCPVEVKRQMIAWWGPILLEYYGASEGPVRLVAPKAAFSTFATTTAQNWHRARPGWSISSSRNCRSSITTTQTGRKPPSTPFTPIGPPLAMSGMWTKTAICS
jgi:long-chain acyl-CoA synthetase